ncbi:MAG: hypothetical protein HY727_21645 [Candidatus Rokubacteria bacterium]|nr:hypothetical protein [Candidatus Rokubacteria bacterium]
MNVTLRSAILCLIALVSSACSALGPGRLVPTATHLGTTTAAPASNQAQLVAKAEPAAQATRTVAFPIVGAQLDPSRPEGLAQLALAQYRKRDFVRAGQHFVQAAQHPAATSRDFRIAALTASVIAFLDAGPQHAKAFEDAANLLRLEINRAPDRVVEPEVDALLGLAATRGGRPVQPSRLPWRVRALFEPQPALTEVQR